MDTRPSGEGGVVRKGISEVAGMRFCLFKAVSADGSNNRMPGEPSDFDVPPRLLVSSPFLTSAGT